MFKPPMWTAWIFPVSLIMGLVIPLLFVPITCSPSTYWHIVFASWGVGMLLDIASDLFFIHLHKNSRSW